MSRLRAATRSLALALLVGLALANPAWGQEQDADLRILYVDTTSFPEVSILFRATDAEHEIITDLSKLRILEDDVPVVDFESRQMEMGVELIFAVDANRSIEQRDEAGGLTRREKVRDSIVIFAEQYMDSQQSDRVSIIVPGAEGGRYLDGTGMVFANEVINAINFYETGEPDDTQLNTMLELALEQAEGAWDEGRYPAILLFSDGAQLDAQLDFESLVAWAQAEEVAFYTALLGSQADPDEVENVTRLYEPTGGMYAHLSQPTEAERLYESINKRARQHVISFRSALNSTGTHHIAAELGNDLAEISFDLVVEPPAVTIPVDNSRPIRRVTTLPDSSLEDIEPTVQPLVAQVSWPDNHPRLLASASLFVNDVEVPLDAPVLEAGDFLSFEWDIRALDSGTYDVQVKVIDELGLEALSEPLPLVIEVERPAPVATNTPAAAPATAVPEPAATPAASPLFERSGLLIGLGASLLALLIMGAVIGVALMIYGRRRLASSPGAAIQEGASMAQPAALPASWPSTDSTLIIPPDFALSRVSGAYLQPIENAPEHSGLIPLVGSNVALGRDPKKVQIPFSDRSVSRLHARILESNGTYRIYDEGSTSGTYLNYERIGLTPHALRDEDDLHFGRVHLRFHLASSLREKSTG